MSINLYSIKGNVILKWNGACHIALEMTSMWYDRALDGEHGVGEKTTSEDRCRQGKIRYTSIAEAMKVVPGRFDKYLEWRKKEMGLTSELRQQDFDDAYKYLLLLSTRETNIHIHYLPKVRNVHPARTFRGEKERNQH